MADSAATAHTGSDAASALSATAAVMRNLGARTFDGAARGVALTRRAVSALPNPMAGMNVLAVVPRVPLGTHSSARLRRMFGGQGQAGNDTVIVPEELSSSDEDIDCSPERLDERVDRKYFDPAFDGCRAEVAGLQATYAESHSDVEGEITVLENAQRERNDQLRVVNAALKKRILENYQVFVDGVCSIREVNADLLDASGACRNSRERLSIARRSFVENGLAIPKERRRRDNLRRLLHVAEVMREARMRGTQLRQLHAAHRFRELVDIAKASTLKDASAIADVVATQPMLAEWADFVKDPEALLRDADDSVERCISKRFDLNSYLSAVDAYVALGSGTAGVKRITSRLVNAGSMAVQRAISDLASKAQGDVATIAASVPPEAISMCVCQICARVIDTVTLLKRIVQCHRSIVSENNPASTQEEIDFHRQMGDATSETALQIGDMVQFNLMEAAANLRLKNDITATLHVFYLLSLALEATSDLGMPAKAMAAARDRLKTVVRDWVSQNLVKVWAREIIAAMESEEWSRPAGSEPSQFSVVSNLSPAKFKADVKRVKAYIADTRPDAENPFFDPELALPQGIADMSVTRFVPSAPHCHVVGAAEIVTNYAFKLTSHVVARYPPLATEVSGWMQQLCSLFIYIAAASFISTSRLTPLEDQREFSPRCREELRKMRENCMSCLPDLAEGGFPPVVYDRIRETFSNQAWYFAIVERFTAMESAVVLTDVLAATVRSVAPLLAKSVSDVHLDRATALRTCTLELLHIGAHRICSAVFPLDWFGDELLRTRWASRNGLQQSTYVASLREKLEALQSATARLLRFPSRYLEDLMWRHVAYAVQRCLVSAFAAVKKKNDAAVTQMNLDASAVKDALREILGSNANTGGERHVELFLRAYFGSPTERLQWIRDHHMYFRSDDILNWLTDDRERRATVETLLREVGHDDHIYVENFVALEQQR